MSNKPKFQHTDIIKQFEGIRLGSAVIGEKYIISVEKGDVAEITYMGEGGYRIYVDNFPGAKKYYSYNFPISDSREFYGDMLRIGLKLQWRHKLCNICEKIKNCDWGNTCIDCERAELN